MEQMEARIAYLEACNRIQKKALQFCSEIMTDNEFSQVVQRLNDYAATETAAFAAGVAECLKN